MIHYEIKYRNYENDSVPCILTNERTQPILKTSEYKNYIVIERFSFSNTNVSLFNPELREPIDDSIKKLGLTTFGGYPRTQWYKTMYVETGELYYTTPYIMMIKTNGTYYSTYIPWIPELPANLPYSSTPQEIAINKYFNSYNSNHFANILTQMLSDLFAACPNLNQNVADSMFTILQGGKISLLIPQTQIQAPFKICFNYDLKRLLGFDCTLNSDGVYELTIPSTIQLISSNNFGIVDVDMCCLTESYIPNARFPYESVVFTTNMEIQPLQYYTNSVLQDVDATLNMLTDYVFSNVDIESFYDKMAFSALCYDRKIAVKNVYKNIQINVLLKTHGDITIPHTLKPLESASMMIYIN